MAKAFGSCHLCGRYGKLTFEHVPPKAAFNNVRIQVAGGKRLINADPDRISGRFFQRGYGQRTLCGSCNNRTGGWYGRDYVAFAYQAAALLLAAKGRPSLYYTYHLLPLRVLKQIICCFFTVNPATFREVHPELERFVLNRFTKGLNPKYQLFAYLTAGDRSRSIGVGAALDLVSQRASILTEFSFPPLGFILCFSSEPPDDRLVDLTFMAKYGYDDYRPLSLRLPVLHTYTPYPGDFRSRDEVRRDREENIRAALGHAAGEDE